MGPHWGGGGAARGGAIRIQDTRGIGMPSFHTKWATSTASLDTHSDQRQAARACSETCNSAMHTALLPFTTKHSVPITLLVGDLLRVNEWLESRRLAAAARRGARCSATSPSPYSFQPLCLHANCSPKLAAGTTNGTNQFLCCKYSWFANSVQAVFTWEAHTAEFKLRSPQRIGKPQLFVHL